MKIWGSFLLYQGKTIRNINSLECDIARAELCGDWRGDSVTLSDCLPAQVAFYCYPQTRWLWLAVTDWLSLAILPCPHNPSKTNPVKFLGNNTGLPVWPCLVWVCLVAGLVWCGEERGEERDRARWDLARPVLGESASHSGQAGSDREKISKYSVSKDNGTPRHINTFLSHPVQPSPEIFLIFCISGAP